LTYIGVADGEHSVLNDTFPTLPNLAHPSLAPLQQVTGSLVTVNLVALQLVQIIHWRHRRSLSNNTLMHRKLPFWPQFLQ